MESALRQSAVKVIQESAANYPTKFIARSEVKRFTGGVYSSGYLANHDSLGTGPKGAFKIGRQVCYPTDSLCDWLIARLEA
ncbi:hypothetical protein [Desulfocastanea catecholica]